MNRITSTRVLVLVALFSLLTAAGARAQSTSGSISGMYGPVRFLRSPHLPTRGESVVLTPEGSTPTGSVSRLENS